jgi:Putative transposase/Transposase zinc-binding domain
MPDSVGLKEPLRQILIATQEIWDRLGTRESVRVNFQKVIACRTAALGFEVYSSDNEELLVPHTCKSRVCSSCGHRATGLWQRDRWWHLFDIRYSMITLTMPDVLWPLFRDNRDFLRDLPSIGARVISQLAYLKYGVLLDINVVPHTFGRHLNFNCHLHVLVSDLGLRKSENRFVPVRLNANDIMGLWRDAITLYLKEAVKLRQAKSTLTPDALMAGLTRQGHREWKVHIARFKSKEQLLRYAGRYVRRPPIAQHRFLNISEEYVEFWTNDRKLKRRVVTRYQIGDFVATLANHIPDHYQHSVRSYGLLAPRSIALSRSALFLLLGQNRRERPSRVKYRDSIRRSFGRDPFIDSQGFEMRRTGRREPQRTAVNSPG